MPSPSTPVLDDFNRPNENPLSDGGNWTGPFATNAGDVMAVVSNQVITATGIVSCSSYWQATSFAQDQEAYLTLPVLPATSAQRMGVATRIRDPNTAACDFYLFLHHGTVFRFYRFDDTTETLLAETPVEQPGSGLPLLHVGGGAWEFLAGMTVWLRSEGSTHFCYAGTPPDVRLIFEITDATYLNGGFVGIWAGRSTPRGDDFGGGSL